MSWTYDIAIHISGRYKDNTGELVAEGCYTTEVPVDSKGVWSEEEVPIQTCEMRLEHGCDCNIDECHDRDEKLAWEKCRSGEITIPDGILPTNGWEWIIHNGEIVGT